MGAKVFISHAHADRAAAQAVARQLGDAGLVVWTDQDLQPGDNWALQSGRALEDSDALVVLLSPEAVASEWVQHEIEYALTKERYKNRVVPVVVRPTRNVPWILRRFPMLDLRTEEDLGGKIATLIGAKPAAHGTRRRAAKTARVARAAN